MELASASLKIVPTPKTVHYTHNHIYICMIMYIYILDTWVCNSLQCKAMRLLKFVSSQELFWFSMNENSSKLYICNILNIAGRSSQNMSQQFSWHVGCTPSFEGQGTDLMMHPIKLDPCKAAREAGNLRWKIHWIFHRAIGVYLQC